MRYLQVRLVSYLAPLMMYPTLDHVSAGEVVILPGTLDEVSTGKVGCSAPAIEEEAGWAPEPVFYSSLKGS